MVLGANCQVVNAKSSMVHENNPDAACMDEIGGRTERAVYRHHHTNCSVNGCTFSREADFALFVRFEKTASYIIFSRTV